MEMDQSKARAILQSAWRSGTAWLVVVLSVLETLQFTISNKALEEASGGLQLIHA